MREPLKKETSSAPTKAMDEVRNEEPTRASSPTIVSQKRRLVKRDVIKLDTPGLMERNCVVCGKIFFPTRPEYAWGACCSYGCTLKKERERDCEKKGYKTRPVEQYTLDGAFVARFESARAAALNVGLTKDRYIRDCCTGKTKTSAGYLWRYEEGAHDD